MDIPPYSAEARSLKPGIYEHFKGKRYRLLNVARVEKTLEEVVVYQQLYGTGDVWVRPVAIFLEEVDGSPRFRYIE